MRASAPSSPAPGPSRPAAALRLALLGAASALFACRSDANLIKQTPELEEEDPGEEAFANDWGKWLSMGVMPDGSPAVAFYDTTAKGVGFALGTVRSDGTLAWAYEQPDGYPDSGGLDPGDRGSYVSMAIAADGTVWLGYRDNQNQVLRYATRAADGSWTSGVADGGSGATPDAGLFASVALTASGDPLIAHHDRAGGTLRLARWQGGAFAGEVVDEGEAPPTPEGGEAVEANVGMFPRLRILNGVEYISYHDSANGSLKLAAGANGGWAVETVLAPGAAMAGGLSAGADVGEWSDMVIADGLIHIGHHDAAEQRLLYTVGEPGEWSTEVVDDAEGTGADVALTVVGSSVELVYFDGFHNDMKRAVRTGDSWNLSAVVSEGAVGFHNEVIVAGGTRWAGCYDYTRKTAWFGKLD
jgi:hypothetical protein